MYLVFCEFHYEVYVGRAWRGAIPDPWTLAIREEEDMIGALMAMKVFGASKEFHHRLPEVFVGDAVHVEDRVLADILVQLHVEARGVQRHVEPIGLLRVSGIAIPSEVLVQQHFGAPLPLQALKGAGIELLREFINEEALAQAQLLRILRHTA